jgi:LDH2 family malate/lactate/ureidoglycolate dehydrogenase
VLAVIDGGKSQGMLAMHAATELAIQRAQQHGSSIIAANNISSATGALG